MGPRRVFVVAMAMAVVLAGCVAVGRSPVACVGAFEATVRQGPSAGLTVQGELAYVITPGGTLRGALRLADGTPVQAIGQAEGHAVHLAFALPDGATLFGVGTATEDVRLCRGAWGGPLVGPQPGDAGDWLGQGGQQCSPPGGSWFYDTETVAPLSESPFADDETQGGAGCDTFPASNWFYDTEVIPRTNYFSDDETLPQRTP